MQIYGKNFLLGYCMDFRKSIQPNMLCFECDSHDNQAWQTGFSPDYPSKAYNCKLFIKFLPYMASMEKGYL